MNRLNIRDRDLRNKTHELRENGVVPGVIYGPTINSTPIRVDRNELVTAICSPGEVYEVVSNRGPVLVKLDEVQRDPVTKDFVHFSLVQLPRGIKNEVEVPVRFKGTPIGVKKGGTLVVVKDEIKMNGKPRSIPNNVVASVSDLDIGDKITVEDLNIPKQVDSSEDDLEVVAVCIPPIKEELLLTREKELESTSNSKASETIPEAS